VHLRDMALLAEKHPYVHDHFLQGHFTVSKKNKQFSCISVDQAHEQLNASIKGDGGAIGLTERETALTRWVTAGPELIRILLQFEGQLSDRVKNFKHHEQTPCFQTKFRQNVAKLVEIFDEEAPFTASSNNELIVLCDHTYANSSVSNTVKSAETIGLEQFNKFVSERLHGSVSINEPLQRNKLPLFNFKPCSPLSTSRSLKVSQLKTDCELFSRLYVACQSRDGDLEEFFKHENHPYPPSLSNHGALRLGSKSDLLACIGCETSCTAELSNPEADVVVCDGAVVVQMLQPGCARTFDEYKAVIFFPYLQQLLRAVKRLDVVFDTYVTDSLKLTCRDKRGSGIRTRVSENTKMPKNWQQFLRVVDNKVELFHFLTQNLTLLACEKTLILTYDDNVVQYGINVDIQDITPCNHEEADTRLILHCLHASKCGLKRIIIRTVDTDVVVLAVSFFDSLGVDKLWVHFGVGKNSRFIAVHELVAVLGPQKSSVLPLFHALTGCDTVSCFAGKGKKSAWNAWNAFPDVTCALQELACPGNVISDTVLAVLERFVIVMYDRTSQYSDLDSCRRHLFTKRCTSLELLPPTSDAFLLHLKRAVLQAVKIWGQSLQKQIESVCPSDWGWSKTNEQWSPLWMTLPEVSKVCRELIHCCCKKGCTGRCKCVKANLACTALCLCDGECSRE
jgi:hypothetical protein